jgi:hypothetical protein
MNEPADRYSPRHTPQHDAGRTDSSPAAASNTEFSQFYRETTKPLVAFLILQGATITEAADLTKTP